MKKDYQTTYEIPLKTQKAYLYQWVQDETLLYQISLCMHEKQLKALVKEHEQDIYKKAQDDLYKVRDFEALEKRLVVMNLFFCHQEYVNLKRELFQKLLKQTSTLEHYCVLRHLVPAFVFPDFLAYLCLKTSLSTEECAKICVIENDFERAYVYLCQLDQCSHEALLDAICSYSVFDYLSLKRHYKQKRKAWVLQPSH